MRPEGCEAELLRALASMPFLDRTEMVALSGRSKGAVYEAVEKLESGGFCASIPHAAVLFPQTQRYHLTVAGLCRLAGEEGASPDDLLRERPLSAQWRRNLMERLDALAAVYRLAASLASVAFPIRFRWYRASPLDAAVELSEGGTVGIVRRGNTSERSPFSNRMWRLRGGPLPGAVLVLMPDAVRLRHSRRMPDDPVWTPAPVSADVDLRSVIASLEKPGEIPKEAGPQRASLPADLTVAGPGWDIPDYMLPATLKSAEKRAVELVFDWPWIALSDLARLMGVSHQRASQIVIPLEFFKLVARPPDADGRLVVTDRGLTFLARRDRTSLGMARSRWSAAPLIPGAPFDWTAVTGRRSRQLLRNVEHTAAVHAFIAHLAAQAATWDGRSPSSTRPRGRPGTSGTTAGCAPSTPTPSASCGRTGRPGPSSWSGSEGRCGPPPCRSASPHICATSHLTVPSTTTAPGPPSWSSSTTRSPTPTSCAWRGRR